MRLVTYEHTRDRHPAARDLPWPAVVRALTHHRPIAGDKAHRARACPLWSPAVYREGATRSAAGVEAVTALVLDYDGGVTAAEAHRRWRGYERVIYTTWRHSPDAHRLRVVMPLAAPIAGADWSDIYRRVWDLVDGRAADPACSDPSRMHYLPAIGAGGPHYAAHRRGDLIDLRPTLAKLRAEEEEERAARVEAMRRMRQQARRAARGGDTERAVRIALATDPAARAALADRLGAVVLDTANGPVARRILCPGCGRPDVYFRISSGWANCNHANSCGWAAPLYDLAAVS